MRAMQGDHFCYVIAKAMLLVENWLLLYLSNSIPVEYQNYTDFSSTHPDEAAGEGDNRFHKPRDDELLENTGASSSCLSLIPRKQCITEARSCWHTLTRGISPPVGRTRGNIPPEHHFPKCASNCFHKLNEAKKDDMLTRTCDTNCGRKLWWLETEVPVKQDIGNKYNRCFVSSSTLGAIPHVPQLPRQSAP